jgi:Zn-dependent metalloprotease
MHNLHPILCSVIPEHMLRNIADHPRGGAAMRRMARATLDEMERLRLGRDRAAITTPPDPGGRRNVYDGGGTQKLPGKLVRSDGGPRSRDVAVNEAYDGAGWTLDFLFKVFTRNSLDGRGMPLNGTVHYGRRFDNAFWNGRQMIYGDGDEEYFRGFTRCQEVISHEHGHGLTQNTSNLVYFGQSGALNEHFSDVIGILVLQWALGQTAATSRWLIGDGIFTNKVKGKALRSMAAPGTAYDDPILGRDPQPAHMSGYVETTEDNGGVHINSGIPNHAFFLASRALGGQPVKVVGLIWYLTMINDIKATTTFQQFADATTVRARAMYGKASEAALAIETAWKEVGLPVH